MPLPELITEAETEESRRIRLEVFGEREFCSSVPGNPHIVVSAGDKPCLKVEKPLGLGVKLIAAEDSAGALQQLGTTVRAIR